MSRRFVERIAVQTQGEGAPVVMLHGLGGSSNLWYPLLPALSRNRVVRIDLPGAARSVRAHVMERGPLTIEVMVEAVLRVCTALGVERAWFVGHSLGSIVCQHIAALHTKCVEGLVLFGAIPAPPEAARAGLKQRASAVRESGMTGVAEAVAQASLSAHTRETQPLTGALVRELLMAQEPECYARSCEALAAAQPADLSRIECSTLLVTGDEDAIAPPHVARDMAGRMPRAGVEILPRCGHWTPLERAPECARLLGDFLIRRR